MTITYQITFYSYWAVGSGKGGGYGKDSLVLKDNYGLPIIPGKTLKGLLRDAAVECNIDSQKILDLFGHEKKKGEKAAPQTGNQEGKLNFNSAYLEPTARAILINHNYLKSGLYDTKTSTAIAEFKQAKDFSLRKMEVTVPVTMQATIENFSTNDDVEILIKTMKMLWLLGEKRYRGLGRCKLQINKKL